jgi:hypothetical protein
MRLGCDSVMAETSVRMFLILFHKINGYLGKVNILTLKYMTLP